MVDVQQKIPDVEENTINLAAGQSLSISAVGEFVRCVENTGRVSISLNRGGEMIFSEGVAVYTKAGTQYSSFQLKNLTDDPITVRVIYGFGRVDDSRLTVTGALNIQIADNFIARPDVDIPAGSSAEIIAANSGRKSVYVHSFRDNEQTLRFADQAGQGQPLYVGDTAVLEVTGSLTLYNAGDNPQTVSITELV